MYSLKEKIQEELKEALKEKRETEVSTLRMINAAVINKEKEKRYKISKEKPGFFEKLMATHPPAEERITEVNKLVDSYGPETKKLPYGQEEYQKIKAHLK